MNADEVYGKVRLAPQHIDAIVGAFQASFPQSDHLWIFGSRTNLISKGGDIDLYVETTLTEAKEVIERKFKMVSAIWRSIGEQKIDVVLNMLVHNRELEIYQQAKQNGIQLV